MHAPEQDGKLPMLRRQKILLMLEREGKVMASDLSQHFKVSEDTIRRDLNELGRAGLLQRVHGGGLPRSSDSGKDYLTRAQQPSDIKRDLARQAVRHVQEGQVVIFDSGTTTLNIARTLPIDIKITAVTNSPEVAIALGRYEGVRVLMIGGELTPDAMAVTGHQAVEMLQGIQADLCFLGICALHAQAGITVSSFAEVATKRAMIQRSGYVVAAVTADKLGAVEAFSVAPAKGIHQLITESDVPDGVLDGFRAQGMAVEPAELAY
ncbi:DeoR/GlpR family DNA-binding transcription regulator [Pseudomonas sp. YJ42]|uniref:DeoR/GlpR family DNA-binding transcription regulator n=1 Tax=Pseudomonas sp. YJ42 TaxID=3392115 RepID=UPI0039A043DC